MSACGTLLLAFLLAASADEPPPWRGSAGLCVLLPDGQRLTGRLIALDAETLTLRTTWADKVTLPRASVRGLVQVPGWITLAEDDLREGTKGWKTTGKPAPTAEGLVLKEVGQAITFIPAAPVEAGRVVLQFRDDGEPASARWTCDVAFGEKDKEGVLRITVAGVGDSYEVEATGLTGTALKVARKPGWHRLTVQFSPRSLRVARDEDLLWFNATEGPGSSLRRIELGCREVKDGKPKGGVIWTEFALARANDARPRPPGDPTQDELWLTSGDQLFGIISRADRDGVEFQNRAVKRTVPWSQLRGCYFRPVVPKPRSTTGDHVQLLLHSPLSKEPDRLEGVLINREDKKLKLRHALLGELVIDAGRVKEVQSLFKGQRLEIDNGPHHLGDAGRVVGDWPAPRAEATSWRGTIKLDAAPKSGRLSINVWTLPRGVGADGIGRTEVIVNGQTVGYLDGRAGLATLTLPRDLLKAGENTLEIQTRVGREGKGRGPCGFEGIVLELPE